MAINPTKSSILRGPYSAGGILTLPLAKGVLRPLGTPRAVPRSLLRGIEFESTAVCAFPIQTVLSVYAVFFVYLVYVAYHGVVAVHVGLYAYCQL
jgi:hypothetical protein